MRNINNLELFRLIDDLICLVFPRICACCGNSLWKHEEIICTSCDFRLPRTRFHLESDNPASRTFWGRVVVENATAYLYFNKGNKAQQLVHLLKYKGRKDIGIFFGEQHGRLLKESADYQSVEMILPVPLHKKKFMKRGFNQSEQYAVGISRVMQIPVNAHILERCHFSDTQTKKSRFERWKNVSDLFTAKNTSQLEGKHVLLVDDVITTGATLEACIRVLSDIPGIRISVAAIAMTVR
jgi:ComF family protein